MLILSQNPIKSHNNFQIFLGYYPTILQHSFTIKFKNKPIFRADKRSVANSVFNFLIKFDSISEIKDIGHQAINFLHNSGNVLFD